jgi:hypothetical protein
MRVLVLEAPELVGGCAVTKKSGPAIAFPLRRMDRCFLQVHNRRTVETNSDAMLAPLASC